MRLQANSLEEAYQMIRAAGFKPINMSWYLEHGILVDGVSSVETWGPSTYGHAKMSVEIRRPA